MSRQLVQPAMHTPAVQGVSRVSLQTVRRPPANRGPFGGGLAVASDSADPPGCPCCLPDHNCPLRQFREMVTKNLVAVLRERDALTYAGGTKLGRLPAIIKLLARTLRVLDDSSLDCGNRLDDGCALFGQAIRWYFPDPNPSQADIGEDLQEPAVNEF
jgi:hypothetical protein